ncbi:MAG: hypothetical protein H0T92_17845, partial [Pyrinomonadaceae bacterium]|nr:hypothetical protein [Pyrinomonadaceae bacterium]
MACSSLICTSLALAQMDRQQAQGVLPQPLVKLSVLVTDKLNRPVSDVRQDELRVFEDGAPQNISFFSREEVPISYGLVIDNSGSLKEQLNNVVEAGKMIINSNRPEDETL